MAIKGINPKETKEYILKDDRDSKDPTIFVIRPLTSLELQSISADIQRAMRTKTFGRRRGVEQEMQNQFDPDQLHAANIKAFCMIVKEVRNYGLWDEKKNDHVFRDFKTPEEVRMVAEDLPNIYLNEIIDAPEVEFPTLTSGEKKTSSS